jgi:hypothetical protein
MEETNNQSISSSIFVPCVISILILYYSVRSQGLGIGSFGDLARVATYGSRF